MTGPAGRAAAIVRRWVEDVWNETDAARRDAALRELHPAEFRNEGIPATPDDLIGWHVRMRETYPDLHCAIDELVEGGDKVTLRWTASGTHGGALWGVVPPTGRVVSWRGLHLITVRDEQILEVWAAANLVDVLQQLDVQLLPAETAPE